MNDLLTTTVVFVLGATGVVAFGVYLTVLADELAERSRMGRAFVGAVLLGALTSLAEIGTSISAALSNHAELAVTNAVGSVAAQTAFIAIADLAYRKANLEHAAASEPNLMLSATLILLIGLVLAAVIMPQSAVFAIHPVSYLLPVIYVFGMSLVARSGRTPMWRPKRTPKTDTEHNRQIEKSGSLAGLWFRFLVTGCVLAISGVVLARSGITIAAITGLSESFVGTLLTGIVSSLPELITAVTAVRIGALTLAISNIIGGNAFDIVIVAFADMAYRKGPIYLDAGAQFPTILVIALLMSAVTLLGLLRRETHGVANIGLEGVILLLLYAGLVYSLV